MFKKGDKVVLYRYRKDDIKGTYVKEFRGSLRRFYDIIQNKTVMTIESIDSPDMCDCLYKCEYVSEDGVSKEESYYEDEIRLDKSKKIVNWKKEMKK